MKTKQKPRRNKLLGFAPLLAGIVALGVVLAVGGFVYAAHQESNDAFCSSCHTQPESTFYQRSTDPQAVDLASYHTAQQTRCIDCHSGQGIGGRVQAELLGARNAAAWYTSHAVQPAQLTFPIPDANCLKCHQNVVQRGYQPKQNVSIIGRRGGEEAGPNHWHEQLARWQSKSANAATCTSCHSGHTTDGSATTGFENAQTTRAVCNACHQQLGEGRG